MKLGRFKAFAAVLFLLPAICLTGCQSRASVAMGDAEDSMEKGNYQNAIESLSKVIKVYDAEDPEDVLVMINAYYLRGDCHAKRGELEEAQADYEQGLAEDTKDRAFAIPDTATRCLRRALIYISGEDWNQAVTALRAGLACEEISCEQELKRNLVICLEKLGDWENAKTAASDYAEAYPEDTEMVKEKDFLMTR